MALNGIIEFCVGRALGSAVAPSTAAASFRAVGQLSCQIVPHSVFTREAGLVRPWPPSKAQSMPYSGTGLKYANQGEPCSATWCLSSVRVSLLPAFFHTHNGLALDGGWRSAASSDRSGSGVGPNGRANGGSPSSRPLLPFARQRFPCARARFWHPKSGLASPFHHLPDPGHGLCRFFLLPISITYAPGPLLTSNPCRILVRGPDTQTGERKIFYSCHFLPQAATVYFSGGCGEVLCRTIQKT